MNPASRVIESRIHKKSMNFIHSVKAFGGGGGGGGEGALHLHLLFDEIVYRLQFCLDFTSLKEVVEF